METKLRESRGIKRNVLVVDDEFINREILGNILSREYDVTYAENGLEAMDKIAEEDKTYSLILLDLLMPIMDGFGFLERRNKDEDIKKIPVIVMTSEKDAEVKSIKLGAADFITKPYDMPEVILARCGRIIELYEDKQIIQSAEEDALTGLYSKEFFFEYIRRLEKFMPDMTMDAIAMNIDHFHLINEIYGREYGDRILRRIAELIINILKVLPGVDGIGCRAEGDTFYMYCVHQDNYDEMIQMIDTVLAELSKSSRVKLRVGVYQGVDKSVVAETWFDRAKLACDRIKDDYIQKIAFYDSALHGRSIFQEKLISDIDDAIQNHHFVVYYQPKYAIQGEEPRLRSAEALIRWNHPELGLISPGDFIPLFESNGLIQRLDNFVWEEAGIQIRKWREKFGFTVPVSVNVSRIDIYDPELESKLTDILERNSLSPEDYMLEITESAYADNARKLVEVTEQLRAKGFHIEMDDFGSGYSSLNMLTSLPIDVLKMDMKFIRNMQKDKKSLRLVKMIMDIAKFLEVPVVAEGVEEELQYQILKTMGCDVIQGYYFSRPVPPLEFEKFIEEEKGKRG